MSVPSMRIAAFDARAGDGVVHAVEAAQQGGLAAAGRADEGGDGVVGDFEIDVEQRLLLAVEGVDVIEADARGRWRGARRRDGGRGHRRAAR